MERDLCKFYDNVDIINKDFSIYEDPDGNLFTFNTINLLTRVEKLQLTKEEFLSLKFQQKVQDGDYNVINIKKPVPKNKITKKEEDRFTIVEKEVAVREIWNLTNAIGIVKSYNNKEEALQKAKEINNKILDYYK